jgi:hypothetical protein
LQRRTSVILPGVLALAFLTASLAHAQATPTATADLHFSAFGGVTGTYTGINLGKNLGMTAGLDASFRAFHSLYPAVEVRGTYPVDNGQVAGERNILAGLVIGRRLEGKLERYQPYGNILVGRGEIQYSPALPNPSGTLLYVQSVSTVISPGAGCNILLSNSLGFKGDFQFQRYETPVTASGSVYSKAFTAGVVYQIHLGGLRRRPR